MFMETPLLPEPLFIAGSSDLRMVGKSLKTIQEKEDHPHQEMFKIVSLCKILLRKTDEIQCLKLPIKLVFQLGKLFQFCPKILIWASFLRVGSLKRCAQIRWLRDQIIHCPFWLGLKQMRPFFWTGHNWRWNMDLPVRPRNQKSIQTMAAKRICWASQVQSRKVS